MNGTGLFSPLLVAAGINVISTIYAFFYLVEPSKMKDQGIISGDDGTDDDSLAEEAPTSFNKPVIANILVGSILDNAGSTGLMPICLSPLMFDVFLGDFLDRGELPIMTPNAYKWLTVLLALMIIPAASSSAWIFGTSSFGCSGRELRTSILLKLFFFSH